MTERESATALTVLVLDQKGHLACKKNITPSSDPKGFPRKGYLWESGLAHDLYEKTGQLSRSRENKEKPKQVEREAGRFAVLARRRNKKVAENFV